MANNILSASAVPWQAPLSLPDDVPILYEDEEEEEMGESNLHVVTDEILHVCLKEFLARYHPRYQAYSNMNLYYRQAPLHPRTKSAPYVSPDLMVVIPYQPLGEEIRSYTIDREGPPPVLCAEILSERSAQQRDLQEKVRLYALFGVAEYILVDITGKFLSQRLLLKKLQSDGSYRDEQDPDGGVTSRFGFRLVLETDGHLRLVDAATGRPYVRPTEAQTVAEALGQSEEARRQVEKARRQAEKARREAEEARREAEERLQAAEETIRELLEKLGQKANDETTE